MKKLLVCCLCVASLLVGCKKKPPSPKGEKGELKISSEEASQALVNDAIQRFASKDPNRKPFETLDQLVKEKVLPELPRMPPGKKLVLDKQIQRVFVADAEPAAP